MSEKFNPGDPKYKKVDDLPHSEYQKYKDVEVGFVEKTAVDIEAVNMEEAILENTFETLIRKPINPTQLESAKFIAKGFGHLWAYDSVFQAAKNRAGENGVTIKDIEQESIEADKDSGYNPSYHLTPGVSSKENGEMILSDESQSRRYQWSVNEDGSYEINVSKANPDSESGGTIVFSVRGSKIGDSGVDIGNKDFKSRHVLCLRWALEIGGCAPADVDKKVAEAVGMLGEQDKKEYKAEIAETTFRRLEDESNMSLQKIAYELINRDDITAQDLERELSGTIKLFYENVLGIHGDKDIQEALGKFEDKKDTTYAWPLWGAISGNYEKLLRSLKNTQGFYEGYHRAPHVIQAGE